MRSYLLCSMTSATKARSSGHGRDYGSRNTEEQRAEQNRNVADVQVGIARSSRRVDQHARATQQGGDHRRRYSKADPLRPSPFAYGIG